MNGSEYHKKLSESINKNRGRIIKLKLSLSAGGLSEADELKYRHAIIKLTAHVKKMLAEEVKLFGGPYSNKQS